MLIRQSDKVYPVFGSLIVAVRDWIRHHGLERQLRLRLDGFVGYEIERMARDVNLSPQELRRMLRLGPDAAKLLLDRMAALHLDPKALANSYPGIMRDLQRVCSNCASKKRCHRDLAHNRDNPVWRQYCPNVMTLDGL
jgi:hypothetical protein